MEPGAILLLLLSAAVHAVWNFLSKASIDKQVFLWLALGAVIVLTCPLLLMLGSVSPAAWSFVVASGAAEAAYFALLGGAYQRGDLSLVYPLVRGSSPVFASVLAVVFLHEQVRGGGLLGIVLIVAGIYTLHVQTIDRAGLAAPLASIRHRSSQLALLSGLATATSVVLDKQGIKYAPPLLYLYLTFLVAAVTLAPFILLFKREIAKREIRVNLKRSAVVGMMFMASYGLVLAALLTSNVSYVSPVREISVVFGALLGTLLLKEPFAGPKLAGAVLICAGIIAIGLAA